MHKNVHVYIFWLRMLCYVNVSNCLMCYNCSSSSYDMAQQCGAAFAPTVMKFNNTKQFLVNCTEDNAMCFVRSWSTRAHYSWLVQRGCYQPLTDDPLPASLKIPTRSMTCKHERLPDGEYKVCLCQSDWCNSAPKHSPFYLGFLTSKLVFIFILIYLTII